MNIEETIFIKSRGFDKKKTTVGRSSYRMHKAQMECSFEDLRNRNIWVEWSNRIDMDCYNFGLSIPKWFYR